MITIIYDCFRARFDHQVHWRYISSMFSKKINSGVRRTSNDGSWCQEKTAQEMAHNWAIYPPNISNQQKSHKSSPKLAYQRLIIKNIMYLFLWIKKINSLYIDYQPLNSSLFYLLSSATIVLLYNFSFFNFLSSSSYIHGWSRR